MESRLIEQNRILLYTIKNREDRQDTQEIAFKKKKKAHGYGTHITGRAMMIGDVECGCRY